MATTQFIADGGDGFTMFSAERGVTQIVDEENASHIIGICKTFFNNMRTDIVLNPKRELARQMRMRDFNVDPYNEVDGCSPDEKFLRIKPEVDERIYAKEGGSEAGAPAALMRKMTTLRGVSSSAE